MKRSFLYVIFSLFLLLLPIGQTTANSNDSIRLSLLTCAPGEVIYTLFGHTAIRYENPSQGIDVVFNYGLFSFDIPNFALRFSLGETDYRLGVIDYPHFAGEYAYFGRSVWQQTLNLNNEEKAELIRLLQENYRPENRVYRYNFFYDNCATRPRDKIEESIAGKVIYPVEPQDGSRTFREIVHQYCKGHPWARFGIDLCIGSEADRPITQRQMMFAPFYLMDAFAGAQITGDSIQRPLVTDSELIVDATPEEDESFWIPTPLQSALLLFILTAAATITASADGQDSGESTSYCSVRQVSQDVSLRSWPSSPNTRLSAPISCYLSFIRASFFSFLTSYIVSEKGRNVGI